MYVAGTVSGLLSLSSISMLSCWCFIFGFSFVCVVFRVRVVCCFSFISECFSNVFLMVLVSC